MPIFGQSQALPGLSKYVSNITVYYERYGFSARVNQRKRSHFVGETRGFGADHAGRRPHASLGAGAAADGAADGGEAGGR